MEALAKYLVQKLLAISHGHQRHILLIKKTKRKYIIRGTYTLWSDPGYDHILLTLSERHLQEAGKGRRQKLELLRLCQLESYLQAPCGLIWGSEDIFL